MAAGGGSTARAAPPLLLRNSVRAAAGLSNPPWLGGAGFAVRTAGGGSCTGRVGERMGTGCGGDAAGDGWLKRAAAGLVLGFGGRVEAGWRCVVAPALGCLAGMRGRLSGDVDVCCVAGLGGLRGSSTGKKYGSLGSSTASKVDAGADVAAWSCTPRFRGRRPPVVPIIARMR